VKADDLFHPRTADDIWRGGLSGVSGDRVNLSLLEQIRRAPVTTTPDAEVAETFLRQLRSDLEAYGTDGMTRLRDDDLPVAIRTACEVTRRLGVAFDVPFRTYAEWRTYWMERSCKGSWMCRRKLVRELFDEPLTAVRRLAERADHQTLGEPISPAGRTGWREVDAEISEVRRLFGMAATPSDYANVGNSCVRLVETISAAVWDPARHSAPGEQDPPIDQTKTRFDRVVEVEAAGPASAPIRRLARATIEFANHLKHGGTPTRRKAGLAADAVISLAHVFRRLRDAE